MKTKDTDSPPMLPKLQTSHNFVFSFITTIPPKQTSLEE